MSDNELNNLGDKGDKSDIVNHLDKICLQNVTQNFNKEYVAGTDFTINVTFDSFEPKSVLLNMIDQDVDLEESFVRLTIDFTDYLLQLKEIDPQILVYDDFTSSDNDRVTTNYRDTDYWPSSQDLVKQPDTTTGTPDHKGGVSPNLANLFEPTYRIPVTKNNTDPIANMNVQHRIIPLIDMNIIDHMWARKRCALGKNNTQINQYDKLGLLLETERKRTGEQYTGKGTLAYMDMMYPLFVTNTLMIHGHDPTGARNYVQTHDGKNYRRLTLGMSTDPMPMCKIVFNVPMKWLMENPIAMIDNPLPTRFPLFWEGIVSCMGEVVRFGILPGPDMYPSYVSIFPPGENESLWERKYWDNKDSSDTSLHQWPDTEYTKATRMGNTMLTSHPYSCRVWSMDPHIHYGRDELYYLNSSGLEYNRARLSTGVAWNAVPHSEKYRPYVDVPNRLFNPGEMGRPIIEIDMGLKTNYFNIGADWSVFDGSIDFGKFMKVCLLPIKSDCGFTFKLKSPSITFMECQAMMYSDSFETTMLMRPTTIQSVLSQANFNYNTQGEVMFSPNGEVNTQNMQVDTADYYKLLFVEDTISGVDKHTSGMINVNNWEIWSDYLSRVDKDIWRLNSKVLSKKINKAKWTVVQTTGRDNGTQSTRIIERPYLDNDDWYRGISDFASYIDIPGKLFDSTLSKFVNTCYSLPIRRRVPCLYISCQYDDCIHAQNGLPISKPRGAHMMNIVLTTVGATSDVPATSKGVKMFVINNSTYSIFFMANGEVYTQVTEESF